MPDDETTEVTEQVTDDTETEVTTDDSSDENAQEALAGFEDDEDKKPETETEVKKPEKPEKEEPEKSEEEAAPEEEVEEKEAEKKEKPEEGEIDEDEELGKKIIEDEDKKEKEAVEAEEAEQKRLEEEKAARAPEAYSNDDIKKFHGVISDNVFPNNIKVGDMELNLGEYISGNPEVKTIASIVSKGIIDTLIKNEYLPSFQGMQDKIDELENKLVNQRFVDRVTDPNFGVPKALEIYNSKEFGEWRDKQSDKIQALFRSDEPKDHIRGFKRYMKAAGLEKADKKVADLDKKRKESKEKADSIYKTTPRSKAKAKPSKETGLSPRDQAKEGFDSDED